MIWKIPVHENRLQPVEFPVASLDEATAQLPQGGYSTFRTFQRTHILHLADHFNRLDETARLAGYANIPVDRAALRAALHQVLSASASDERVRVILDLSQEIGDLYLLTELLHTPPDEAYQRGVKAVTRTLHRDNPKAKLTEFIGTAAQVRQTLPADVNEALMVAEDGSLLEGLSSNFFAVCDGTAWTADKGVLSGITRAIVLNAIHALDIPLRLQGLSLASLSQIQEAFITSASRDVLPVTEIDGKPVGTGMPGELTLRLLSAYRKAVMQEAEEV